MKNFSIGKEIKNLIEGGGVLTGKVFPLISNANTTFPFLVYRRINYQPQSTKDYTGEVITIEINIATETYNEGVELANSVADILTAAETQTIENIKLTNVSELYLQDTFIQNLQFQIELKI